MRMWLINPKKLCRKHLLGEHLEMHMFAGAIKKGKGISGYIKNDLVVLGKIKSRHDKLAKEMKRRGYKHKSKLANFNEGKGGTIVIRRNIEELRRRCKDCRKLLK